MTTDSSTESKNKRRKIILWSVGPLFLLLCMTACILMAMAFDDVPMPLDHYYLRRPKEKEPFIPFYVMQKGENNYEIMRKSNPYTRASISYEDDEFNYILRNVIFSNLLNQSGATGGNRITAKRTSLILKEGLFHLKYTMETPGNPFGKYLNLHLVMKLTVKDGVDHIEIVSAKAGSLNIPKFIMEAKVNEVLKENYRGTSQEKLVKECIIDLKTDDKGISAEYRPYVLRKELKNVSGGATGEFLGQLGYDDSKN
ncbi:MAG: hypothetical protein E7040_02935 [Lentisphaerae bacterium]|nr:hypothetical protein [Lentisphaerota bacterium]